MPDDAVAVKDGRPDHAINALNEELTRYQRLRRTLEADDGLDEQTLLDTLEGATDLNECLLALADEVQERDASAEGLKSYIANLQARKSRYEKTSEAIRAIILHAMDRAGIPTITGERCTLSTRKVAPGLIVEDEAMVPSAYWKPSDPTLNKKALKEALDSGTEVPGAKLSNGGIGLTVRVK